MLIEFQKDNNIRYDYAASIYNMTCKPEAKFSSITPTYNIMWSEDNHCCKVNNTSLNQGVYNPFKENPFTEAQMLDAYKIKFSILHKVLFVYRVSKFISWFWLFFILIIEDCIIHDRERSHGNVVQLVDDWFVEGLTCEAREESKIELCCNIQDIFVERVYH